MAKTLYSFKLGQRNFFGLTHDKLGSNLPTDSWDKWRPLKTVGKGSKIGLSDKALKELDDKGYYIERGLKFVAVESGQVAAPPLKKKSPARKKK